MFWRQLSSTKTHFSINTQHRKYTVLKWNRSDYGQFMTQQESPKVNFSVFRPLILKAKSTFWRFEKHDLRPACYPGFIFSNNSNTGLGGFRLLGAVQNELFVYCFKHYFYESVLLGRISKWWILGEKWPIWLYSKVNSRYKSEQKMCFLVFVTFLATKRLVWRQKRHFLMVFSRKNCLLGVIKL